MKTAVKIIGGLLAVILLGALGTFFVAKNKASARLAATFETHKVDFPVPFPLSAAELEEIRTERAKTTAEGEDPMAGIDLNAIALERAITRGKHLIESRYACSECHGPDFAGGTMVESGAIGNFYGVNLTGGKGGVVANYKVSDWDRIVRHGVKPDGRPAAMPSSDFFAMSDHELSDIIATIKNAKPVDKEMPRPTLGPIGTMLVAFDKMPVSAEELKDHQATHTIDPPATAVTPQFGEHLVKVCTGCHTPSLAGGPILAGPPDWPPARNLTPHQEGLAGWAYEDFVRAMREGKRKNGETLKAPMSMMTKFAANISETEMKAMWAYIQSVPPKPTPK